MPFCTDTDLLYWEPGLFRDAAAASQVLVSGIAGVSGTAVTVAGVPPLADAGVRPLGVIQFSGTALSGCFPIVSVDSDTDLTISVLYDGLFPADGSAGTPAHVGVAAGQAFAVRTFFPQRQVVTQMLLQAAGVDPSAGADAEGRVVNAESLRRPCVLGTLQMIYNAVAASATEPAKPAARADLYERLYRRAMRSARVEVDTDGDGVADVVRSLGGVQLVRG